MYTANIQNPGVFRPAAVPRRATRRRRAHAQGVRTAPPAVTLAITIGLAILAVFGALAATAATTATATAVTVAVAVMLLGLGAILYVTRWMLDAPAEDGQSNTGARA